MGKSYLVTGARLRCIWGSKPSQLVITQGHNCAADGRPKANCTDCKKEENIYDFGICGISGCGKTCKECMSLADKWVNTSGSSWKLEKLNGDTALTMDSILLCRKGGIIVPETSGQGDVREIDWKQLMARYPVLGFAAALGKMRCSVFGFDPVNLNTGNFVYEKEDLIIHGITRLSFHATYNSMEEYRGGSLGEGWHHNYEISVEDNREGMITLHLGDGQTVPYRKSIGNLYTPLLKGTGLIKQEPGGYHYAAGEGMEYTFDETGRLLTRKDRNGNTDHFVYNSSGQLSEARGANGGVLYYRYNKEGNLCNVRDHTGREVNLRYSYRVLSQYINPSGQAYTYGYNENLRLESVITPRGIEGIRNVYDGANRVVSQKMPDGSVAELRYDDEGQCTYAKDQNGYITAYESDSRFRNIRTVYKDGEERFAYNDNDQLTMYTDKNGNKTQYRYDDRGRLLGSTDALGIQRFFTYNGEGKLLTAGIEGDRLLENTYDRAGRLVGTTDALGRSRETIYDEKGWPEQIVQPDGSRIRLTHDERGNISSVTDPYGVTVTYGYDALNRVVRVTDNEGNRVSYQYDERDRLLSETNQEGAVRSYTYDESGRPIRITDFDGGVTSVEYNAVGKPEKVTDKEGNETRFIYDPAGNLSEEISPTGAVSAYRYDRNNRLVQAKLQAEGEDGEARVVDYIYDPAGNLLKMQAGGGKDPLSVTTYEYDVLNRVTAVTDPVGGKTTYQYDRKSGRVSSITDAAGNRRMFRYNRMGELIEETDIRGNTTKYEYNALGSPVSVTDGAGRTTRHYYLPGGRRERTVYPDGTQMSYEYDSLGRLKKRSSQNGNSITYGYDCMGRVQTVTGSAGQQKSYTYDVMGNVSSVTDAEGNTTRYAYTFNGRLREVTDASGSKTEYTYDKADRLACICQHGQEGDADRITEYERDVFGQVRCIRDASGGEEYFRYDALGRMTEKTDREGLVTAYTYMADGRLESVLYGDGRRAEMKYSQLGKLAIVKDWLGETRIDRDSHGMPVSITDHNGRTVHYEWGSMGQRQGMTYPDGTRISWTYDSLLRPIQMKRTAEGRETLWTDYKYDQQGRLSEKKSSGVYDTRWHYNETGLLEELCHADASGILDRFRYTYDAMGNRTMITKERRGLPEESGVYQYIYDGLQRLTGVEKDGKPLRSYRYDAFGNRTGLEDHAVGTRSTYGYDALNHLLEQETWQGEDLVIHKTYTYDRRGNLTGEYQDGGLLHGYVYDSMNRLQRAWDSQGAEAEYFYNALGHRTGRSAGGQMEEYLLDLTKLYHNLLELRRGEHRQTFYWDMGVSAMEDENRIIQYCLSDELGSPLRVLYQNGNGDAYGYDEFGVDLYDPEAEQYGGNRYSRQGECQPFGYTGYRHDDISGTYFAQAREYQPEAGRFVAEDVIHGRNTVPKTLNRYGYCWGNPIGYIDANGKFPETQDEMWQEFLEYYFGGLKEVFDNKWDSFNRDIQEKYEEIKKEAGNFLENTKNAAKNAGYFAIDKINKGAYWIRDTTDSALDTINDGVHWAKDTLSEHPGSIATGADLSITGSIVQQDFMLGPTLCTNGDLGLQFTYSPGITLWSNTCSAAYMRYLTITNAPSLEALEGDGFNVGGSYMFPIEEVIVALGLDVNFIGRNAEYLGLTATAGLGLGNGPEVHGQVGYTHTLWKINLFDEWDKFYSKYKEKRCESVK